MNLNRCKSLINYDTRPTSSVFIPFNTFASQRLIFEGKNEPFIFENGSNLTHDNFKQEN